MGRRRNEDCSPVARWLGWRKDVIGQLHLALSHSFVSIGKCSDVSCPGVYHIDCLARVGDDEVSFVVSISEPEFKVNDRDVVRKCPCGNIIMEVGLETCAKCRGVATKYEVKRARKIVTAVARDDDHDDDPSEEGVDSIAIEASDGDDMENSDDEP